MIPSAGLARIVDTLSAPTYGSYVVGNGISLIGTWMQRIAVGWLAWSLTGSSLWLGLIAFADLFPTVIVGPLGGAFADRVDRLRLVQVSQILACGQAASLFALTITGAIDIYLLVALTLFLGTVTALNQPARLALVPSLVAPHQLNAAIGINSVIFNLARFIGPAIAGFIIAGGNVAWVFGLNALSFGAFLFILFRLRLGPETRVARQRKRFHADLADGVAYAARTRHIAVQLLLLMAIGLGARPMVELLPGIADVFFAGGPKTLALLTSTFGAGAIAGGLWLAGRRTETDLAAIVTASALVLAAALGAFILSPSLWFAVPAVAVLGVAMVITGAGIQTLLQVNVDSAMRGRVLSLYGLIMRGGPALGALAMGWAAEYLGLRWPLAGGAALVALAALAIAVRMRRPPAPAGP